MPNRAHRQSQIALPKHGESRRESRNIPLRSDTYARVRHLTRETIEPETRNPAMRLGCSCGAEPAPGDTSLESRSSLAAALPEASTSRRRNARAGAPAGHSGTSEVAVVQIEQQLALVADRVVSEARRGRLFAYGRSTARSRSLTWLNPERISDLTERNSVTTSSARVSSRSYRVSSRSKRASTLERSSAMLCCSRVRLNSVKARSSLSGLKCRCRPSISSIASWTCPGKRRERR